MTELLEFEWERRVDGYRLERLDADLLIFVQNLADDHWPADDGWFINLVDSSAPQWLLDLINREDVDENALKHDLENASDGDRYLVANGRETERYRPVDMYPALFMELADSEDTREGAARFISRYGLPNVAKNTSIQTPADLWTMSRNIWAIKSAVRSWEQYRKTGKAKAFIKGVTDALLTESHLHVELREMPEHDTLSMVIVPHSLIAAIWLQFAQAITANYGFRQCDECLTWFEVAPGKGRPEKRFCSSACSMRAYRKRKSGNK